MNSALIHNSESQIQFKFLKYLKLLTLIRSEIKKK